MLSSLIYIEMRMQQNAHAKEQHMHIKANSFKGVVFLLCFIHYVFLRLWFRFGKIIYSVL